MFLGGRQFADRAQAGRELAERLQQFADRQDVLVLALPRGGVPVAYEVARSLHVPLDVFIVRKLGVPGHEELAMGAVASGGTRVLNQEVLSYVRVPREEIELATRRELEEVERREKLYRGDRPPPKIEGRTVILVDDGLATGSTMRAAVHALRGLGPQAVVVAVPTAAPQTCAEVGREVDEVICVMTPEPFYAVGAWYQDFAQTSDEEVRRMLRSAWEHSETREHSKEQADEQP
ncbi:MAG: phosphoribosyltransferase [Thermoleophilia bacterium]